MSNASSLDGVRAESTRLFVKVVDHAPRVKKSPTADGASRPVPAPALLDCEDLAAARRVAKHLRAHAEADRPSPLLLLAYGTTELGGHRDCVAILETSRAVVSLLVDVHLLGIADGIVLVSSSGRIAHLEDEIKRGLALRGIEFYGDLPGYELVTDCGDHTGARRGAAVS
jgi:hypothetical protein